MIPQLIILAFFSLILCMMKMPHAIFEHRTAIIHGITPGVVVILDKADEDTAVYATAFETIYFWPDIEKSFAEVRRVLAPGGKFLIVNEDDGLSGNNEKWEKMIDGMHTYTPDEIKAHLTAAGFQNITIHRKESKRWLAATAVK